MTIEKIRDVFQLKKDEYSGRMNNFTKYVIEKPLAELNEKTNINITYLKIKDGKNVLGFRFTCSEKVEEIKITKTDSKKLIAEKKKSTRKKTYCRTSKKI
jgi:Initiator Replication protein.